MRRVGLRRLALIAGLALLLVLVVLGIALAAGPDSKVKSTLATVKSSTVTTAVARVSASTTAATVARATTSTLPRFYAAKATQSTSSSTTATSPAHTASTSKVVVIDPGHQAKGDHTLEPNGPGSTTMKDKVSDGTAGCVTRIPESKLTLSLGLKLRQALQAHGIKVVMTRTTQNVNISNIQRAKIANAAHADLFVRIHADGSTDSATHGIHVLYPKSIAGWTNDIAAASKTAAEIMQRHLVEATGATDRGIDMRSDQTGFNWSNVPVVLAEVGFMTNPTEDRLMATDAYQNKIVAGLTAAILEYLGAN